MPDLRERKGEHLDLAKMPSAMAQVENSLDRVRLTHQALPEIDADDVDTSTKFLNYRLAMPLMISGMTSIWSWQRWQANMVLPYVLALNVRL
jgi:isopentenyl-diphosphate delta-isomerase